MTLRSRDDVSDLARKALRTWTEEEAETVLSDWLGANGPDPAILQWRALLLRALDRRAEAIALLQQAARILPTDGGIAHALAQVHLEAGLRSSVLFETALRLAPTRIEARLSLIAAYYAEGRGGEALNLLAGALDSNPGWLDGHRQFAQLCNLLGRSEEALKPLCHAIARFPDVLPLRIDALELLMSARDYAGAVDLADQGLSRSGNLPELMVRKATALDELGQQDQAGALFSRCGDAQDGAHACRLIRHHLRQDPQRRYCGLQAPGWTGPRPRRSGPMLRSPGGCWVMTRRIGWKHRKGWSGSMIWRNAAWTGQPLPIGCAISTPIPGSFRISRSTAGRRPMDRCSHGSNRKSLRCGALWLLRWNSMWLVFLRPIRGTLNYPCAGIVRSGSPAAGRFA